MLPRHLGRSIRRYPPLHRVSNLHSRALSTGKQPPPQPPPDDDYADDTAAPTTPRTVRGIVSTILHGSRQVKEELTDTYSKVLARGKYVHEIESELVCVLRPYSCPLEHHVKPECIDEYIKLVYFVPFSLEKTIIE